MLNGDTYPYIYIHSFVGGHLVVATKTTLELFRRASDQQPLPLLHPVRRVSLLKEPLNHNAFVCMLEKVSDYIRAETAGGEGG